MAQTPKPSDAIRIGQVFLEKYRVESILGQGGMGVVAECTHLQLNERVALKMLRQDVLLDRDAVERFMREAQAAVKLKSEYVARVRDVGTLENGTPFMVMEYLDGQDLGVLIEERGTLPAPWATELILQTCEGLAEAHSLGIVHRDIKPTNLFVTWRPDGTALIKVLDFGISKSPMGTEMHLTQTQSLLGTPAYMSPEQMRSARLVDGRTDIWSLGTVLYELLEGQKPFEAESFSEMCVKVAVDSPTPMTRTSVELQHVVLRCLAKAPEARYQSMADLARDLVPFTQDPQSASMLVERMQRMQRRADGNWEGTTAGAGTRGVPHHVRDVGSAPVRAVSPAAGWHGGSEPSGQRFAGNSDPSGARWHSGSDASGQMFRATPQQGALAAAQRAALEKSAALVTMPTHPRRGGFGFVLLGVAIVAIAGVAIALGMGIGADPDVERAKTMDPPSIKMEATLPAADPPVAPPVADPTPPTPAVTVPKPAVIDDKGEAQTTTRPKPTSKVTKKPTIKKPEIKVIKEPVKDPTPVIKPKCDPFATSHARPCS